MTISINAHSDGHWTATAKQRGTSIWVNVRDAQRDRNDISFFFADLDHAQAVADAFNNPPAPF